MCIIPDEYAVSIEFTAVMLMLTWLVFENVCDSLGNNDSFYKNDENTLRFKGNSWESLDENHEKEGTTTKDAPCGVSFLYRDFH